MSEKNLNDISEERNSFYGMFDENTNDYIITQNMNRDYLWGIYNDDMDSLNKEIRMTRSDYLRRRVQIEKYIDAEIKADKKRVLIFFAVFIAACILAVPFFLLGAEYQDIFVAAKNPLRDASLNFTTEEVRAFWAASGFFTTVAWILFVVGIVQFIFFAGGLWKHIHRLKRHKEKALERLDYSKKEHMLLGTYDALK